MRRDMFFEKFIKGAIKDNAKPVVKKEEPEDDQPQTLRRKRSPYNSSNNKRSTQKKALRSKRLMNMKD